MSDFLIEDAGYSTLCWIWKGCRDKNGYPRIHRPNEQLAHRWFYIGRFGSIPSGLEMDHLCRNRACVNPDHLEAVTRQENVRRREVARTHCKRGHEFTNETTKMSRGRRICMPCAELRNIQRRVAA